VEFLNSVGDFCMSENIFLTPDPFFPYFFDDNTLVADVLDLGEKYGAKLLYAQEVRKRSLNICAFEKYFPSPQVIERFFLKEDVLFGYQCVFFDGTVDLTLEEEKGLRAYTLKGLINSLDRRVLLKIAIVWNKDEPEIHPSPVLFSNVMKESDLHFMQTMLIPYH
jgi:hypothetical protein